MASLSKELKCIGCEKIFFSKQGYEKHIVSNICSKRIDRYVCKTCGLDCKQKINYDKHMNKKKKCKVIEKKEIFETTNNETVINETVANEIVTNETVRNETTNIETKHIETINIENDINGKYIEMKNKNKILIKKIKELEIRNNEIIKEAEEKIKTLEEIVSKNKGSMFEIYERGVRDVIFEDKIDPKDLMKDIEIIIHEKTKKKIIQEYINKLKNKENIIYNIIEKVFSPRGWIEMIDEREILEKYIKFYLKIKNIFNEEQNNILTSRMEIAKESYE